LFGDDLDDLARRLGRGVGHVEDLADGFVTGAEGGQRAGGIGDVGVAVGLIGVTDDPSRLAGQSCADHQVAQR